MKNCETFQEVITFIIEYFILYSVIYKYKNTEVSAILKQLGK